MVNLSEIFGRILVTGATGFIGANLVKHLVSSGMDAHIIVRPGSKLCVLEPYLNNIVVHVHDGSSACMQKILAEVKPQMVYHFASLFLAQHTAEDLEPLIHSNLLFPTQLLEAMATNEVKYLVNTGTSWQHFNNEIYNPVNLYAATKQAFEDVLSFYSEAHGIKATTLALFDTYGPNDPRAKLINLLWRTAMSQEPLVMSPGDQLIDLVYIDDVVSCLLLVGAALPEQQANLSRYGVSSGVPMKLREVVTLFEKVTRHKLPITWGGRPYRPREVMQPWSDFKLVPNWEPQVSLEKGLSNMYPLPAPSES